MRHVLVALMLLVAVAEASSVTEFAEVFAPRPAAACSCECGCHCVHCRQHRDHEAPASDGRTGLDGSGCSIPGSTRNVIAPALPFEVPALVTLPGTLPVPLAHVGALRALDSLPARLADPPPRLPAA